MRDIQMRTKKAGHERPAFNIYNGNPTVPGISRPQLHLSIHQF